MAGIWEVLGAGDHAWGADFLGTLFPALNHCLPGCTPNYRQEVRARNSPMDYTFPLGSGQLLEYAEAIFQSVALSWVGRDLDGPGLRG